MRLFILVLLCLPLPACSQKVAPPCPLPQATTLAPSAGCMAVQNGRLLVVEDLRGGINVPGGKSAPGESAQCAAHRETWEETGLNLQVGELKAVMDTGFHLYDCRFGSHAGAIDPPPRMEIKRAFLLAPSDFGNYDWRFPGQEQTLKQLMEQQRKHD